MWFSASESNKLNNSTPFATVAFAGHTVAGNFCECGTPACLCDPGEEMTGHSVRPVPDASPNQRNPKAKPDRLSGLDFSTGAFLIGLALFMWARLRT